MKPLCLHSIEKMRVIFYEIMKFMYVATVFLKSLEKNSLASFPFSLFFFLLHLFRSLSFFLL